MGEFLKELDLTEGRSTGIPTIQSVLSNNGSPLALFDTDDDRSYFLVEIHCHPNFKNSLKLDNLDLNSSKDLETGHETGQEKGKKRARK